MVIACPGCGRTTSTFFQELADKIQSYLREQMPRWRSTYPGVESMNVAVMGCVVNGPGESKHANIGISLPGTGEAPVAPVFVDGERTVTLKGERIAEEFQAIVERLRARRNGTARTRREADHEQDQACRGARHERPVAADAPLWERFEARAIDVAARLRLPADPHAAASSTRRCSCAASARSPTSSKRRCIPSRTGSTANT